MAEDFNPNHVGVEVPELVSRTQHDAVEQMEKHFKADAEERARLRKLNGELGVSAGELLKQMDDEQKKEMERILDSFNGSAKKFAKLKAQEQEKKDVASSRRFPPPPIGAGK